ncbi:spore cortex-lytic enzyme [Clostridium botulinum]|uniref:Spore cortex-lytic enzyme n=1 Tax=Clostridium botulinum C/D str. DC5 TaxID=1443128 RepID=A0A0A0ID51_CLOBO|nr:spore cortex-lytic enzyme [Clostridium botulinum]KEI06641.1 cell wall hydrolase [Clostridium botulinum C/D str. BKT75002]KEI09553.1 cell wall hydrolase [Clostridium botulinum C/D str. BKT2873]KGM93425.1 cell wall hydrolase [Clostridium botulinum D str. CCUG 7971]KGM98867.1 cell wall hydrolase [Clostridium botulinum C/D str. DC5]KOC46901.1 cell wall hydrolase [Clostridium botulinum]
MKGRLDCKRICLLVVVLLFSYAGIPRNIIPYYNAIKTSVYKYGTKDSIVTEIQRRLKAWDYYDGELDGKYGYETYLAVKEFQRKNDLTVDGIVGDYTLAALGINDGKGGGQSDVASNNATSNNSDVMLLARLINGEARGEPYEGQVAVGAVVLNRTRDSRFPSSIAGVIYQPGAFTAIVDGQINAELEQSSIKAARDALNGWDPSDGAVYYFNPDTATSGWIWSRQLIKIIGKHRFCS